MSREDEMRKGAEVIQQHLREPNYDTRRKNVIGVRGAPKTLAGVPRKGAAEMLTISDQEIESARLTRLAKVREWERAGHLTMVPFFAIRSSKWTGEVTIQAVRVGGVFFEEREDTFPSEHVFANIALAVKAGVTEAGEPPIFNMEFPGDKK